MFYLLETILSNYLILTKKTGLLKVNFIHIDLITIINGGLEIVIIVILFNLGEVISSHPGNY